jgi:hypothetical protein
MRVSRTSEFLTLSRRLMRWARSIQISLIWSLNHIRRVSSHVVQHSRFSRSIIIHAMRYEFIILMMFSWTKINLYLFRRLTFVQRTEFLFLDISSAESMSSIFSRVDFSRDWDDWDWDDEIELFDQTFVWISMNDQSFVLILRHSSLFHAIVENDK